MLRAKDCDVERTDRAVGRITERKHATKIGRRPAERPSYASALGHRRDDRQDRSCAIGMMRAHMGERDEIKPVVAVQVTDIERVECARIEMTLERPERPVAEVEQQPEPVVLNQVGRARGIRAWMAPGAAHDGEPHARG